MQHNLRSDRARVGKTRIVCRDDLFVCLFEQGERNCNAKRNTHTHAHTCDDEKCKYEKRRCDVMFAEDNFV